MKWLIPIILLFPSIALGAPSISGTSGTWSHGESVTVSGSSFGSKSPAAPFWWDDGEGATDTQTVPTSGEMTWVTSTLTGSNKHYNDAWPSSVTEDSGAANIRYRSAPYRSVSAPHSNSTKFITGGHDDEGECLGGEVAQNVGVTVSDATSTHDDWYVHYWHTLDPLWREYSGGENYKYFNWESASPYKMYDTVGGYDNVTACSGGYNLLRRCPSCMAGYMTAEIVLVLDGTDCQFSTDSGYPVITYNTNIPNPAEEWVQAEHIVDWTGDIYQVKYENKLLLDSTATVGCDFDQGPFGGATLGGFWSQKPR
jgi:hypothetical protein